MRAELGIMGRSVTGWKRVSAMATMIADTLSLARYDRTAEAEAAQFRKQHHRSGAARHRLGGRPPDLSAAEVTAEQLVRSLRTIIGFRTLAEIGEEELLSRGRRSQLDDTDTDGVVLLLPLPAHIPASADIYVQRGR